MHGQIFWLPAHVKKSGWLIFVILYIAEYIVASSTLLVNHAFVHMEPVKLLSRYIVMKPVKRISI